MSNFNTPNYLFRNDGIGGFVRITGPSEAPVTDGGPNEVGSADYMKPVFGDINNDGLVDMFYGNEVYLNSIPKSSTPVVVEGYDFKRLTTGDVVNDNLMGQSAYFADFDNDGWLARTQR